MSPRPLTLLSSFLAAFVVAAVIFSLAARVVLAAPPAAAPASMAKPVVAYPKGHYAAMDKLPDWGGVWVLTRPAPGGPPPERPLFKGQYLKDYEAWQKAVKDNGGEAPHHGSYCLPPGMPGIMAVGQYPMEFFFTPGRVTTHHEAWMQWRNIYTDGRGHPDDLDATFQGDSIGHWEGETLVVDTIGIKEAAALAQGMGHSKALHLIERMHQVKGDPETLVDEMTVEDPQALEKPWQRLFTYKRSRELQLLEFECAENDRNPVDSEGKTGFKRSE
jgi:hypothetical protein